MVRWWFVCTKVKITPISNQLITYIIWNITSPLGNFFAVFLRVKIFIIFFFWWFVFFLLSLFALCAAACCWTVGIVCVSIDRFRCCVSGIKFFFPLNNDDPYRWALTTPCTQTHTHTHGFLLSGNRSVHLNRAWIIENRFANGKLIETSSQMKTLKLQHLLLNSNTIEWNEFGEEKKTRNNNKMRWSTIDWRNKSLFTRNHKEHYSHLRCRRWCCYCCCQRRVCCCSHLVRWHCYCVLAI